MRPNRLRRILEHSWLRTPITALLRWKGKMTACIFCKIIKGDAPASVLYRDQLVTAFRDAHPVARIHVLIVPNQHIESINQLHAEDESLIGHMFSVAKQLAKQEHIHNEGYRLIINTGRQGGQTVPHLHLHLIGGGRMRYPIG